MHATSWGPKKESVMDSEGIGASSKSATIKTTSPEVSQSPSAVLDIVSVS